MANKSMLYSLKVGAFLAKYIPRNVGLTIITFFASLYGYYRGDLYRRIKDVQSYVSPNLTNLQMQRRIREVIASYARYWWDVFWLSSPRKIEEINNIVSVDDVKLFNQIIDNSKKNNIGIIITLAHMGSWEIPGAFFAGQGHELVAVAERLKPTELFELFSKTRADVGINVIAHDDHPTTHLLEALKMGKAVVLVADRDISKKGIEVSFFGKTKTMPGGPASLALKTGAVILPMCTYETTGNKIDIVLGTPIYPISDKKEDKDKQIAGITQQLAKIFEDFILRNPSQWHVLRNEWKSHG